MVNVYDNEKTRNFFNEREELVSMLEDIQERLYRKDSKGSKDYKKCPNYKKKCPDCRTCRAPDCENRTAPYYLEDILKRVPDPVQPVIVPCPYPVPYVPQHPSPYYPNYPVPYNGTWCSKPYPGSFQTTSFGTSINAVDAANSKSIG